MRQRTYISTGGDADKIASYMDACFEYLCIKRLQVIYLLYMARFLCTIWSQDCFIIFPVDLN